MRRIMTVLFMALLALTGCEYDDSALNDRLDGLEDRVERLENLCDGFNSDIAAMRTILDAMNNGEYVTSIEPILDNGKTVGYAITFSKSGVIKIYNGKDGQDGTDGQDGQGGEIPVIGVVMDADGFYYWTLDGEYLLDKDGKRIKAGGRNGEDGTDGQDGQDGADGQDGTDGQDGADGQDGVDGKDGVTPQLKIGEDGMWYISTDNGQSWDIVGQATAPDGTDGTDAQSYFSDVEWDEDYIYFTLADGETVLTLPYIKGEAVAPVESLVYITGRYVQRIFLYEKFDAGKETERVHFRVSPKKVIPQLEKMFQADPSIIFGNLYLKNVSSEAEEGDPEYIRYKLPVSMLETDAEEGTITVMMNADEIPDEFVYSDKLNDYLKRMSLSISMGGEVIESKQVESVFKIIGNYVELRTDNADLETLRASTAEAVYGSESGYKREEIRGVKAVPSRNMVIVGFGPGKDTLRPFLSQVECLDHLKMFSLKAIGKNALKGCPALQTVVNDSVHHIGASAFEDCRMLKSYTVADFRSSLDCMEERAFMNCESLEKFTCQGSITYLPEEAFKNCTSLENVEEAKQVTDIRPYAFENSAICWIDSPVIETIQEGAFKGTIAVQHMTFSNLREMGKDAFRNSSISAIELGSKLEVIHSGAFFDSQMGYMVMRAMVPPALPDGLILNNPPEDEVEVRVKLEVMDDYRRAPGWSEMYLDFQNLYF